VRTQERDDIGQASRRSIMMERPAARNHLQVPVIAVDSFTANVRGYTKPLG